MEQIVKFGENSISFLEKFLSEKSPKSIFLVTGKNSFINSGASDYLNSVLRKYNYIRFFDFEENPKIEDVERGIDLFNQNNCDLTIAVGGGSVIDMAKLINIFHSNTGELSLSIISGEVEGKVVPFIAIPTTSGTGSESTHFAVVYVDKKKYSVAHNLILPNIVLINPFFTFSASSYLTAITGLDAFAQAIESFWSVNSTEESKSYSKEAIEIIWNNLSSAVKENDKSAKERLSWASHLAGKSINITKTTAPHACSYPFTTYYNIPHGHAVSLFLSYFLEYNYNVTDLDLNDIRGVGYVRSSILQICNIIGETKVDIAKIKIIEFIDSLGISSNVEISRLGKEKDIEIILENINIERLSNNPRKLSKELLKQFLDEVFV